MRDPAQEARMAVTATVPRAVSVGMLTHVIFARDDLTGTGAFDHG